LVVRPAILERLVDFDCLKPHLAGDLHGDLLDVLVPDAVERRFRRGARANLPQRMQKRALDLV
jgi:hypothetical protein